jgi:hypothetical protein
VVCGGVECDALYGHVGVKFQGEAASYAGDMMRTMTLKRWARHSGRLRGSCWKEWGWSDGRDT